MKALSILTDKKIVSITLSIIVLLFIVYKLASDKNIPERFNMVLDLLKEGNNTLLFLMLLLSPCNWLVEAFKWQFLLSKIQHTPYLKALGSVLSGMSFALISPGKVGDFAGRLLFLDNGIRWRAFFMTIIGSFSHILVTCIMGVTGLIYLWIHTGERLFALLFAGALLLSVTGLYLYMNINKYSYNKAFRKKWIRKILYSFRVIRKYDTASLMRVLLLSGFKFILYNTQFVLAAYLLGAQLELTAAFLASCVMFWMIMVIPSFFMADVIIRGMVANLIFLNTGLVEDTLPYISASYIIWLTNWVVPSAIGGCIFLVRNLVTTNKII